VMRDGRLQQVAPPMTLYQRPANRFVAELMGRPAMNILAGQITPNGDGLAFRAGDFVLSVPSSRQARLQSYADRPILLGIRPEHIVPAGTEGTAGGSPGGATCRVSATITAVEPLGAESHVHASVAGHDMVTRLAAVSPPRVGEPIELAILLEHLHFFDPETEQAIE
jgi:multiple sugar transport system ATP-binding protein